MRRRSGYSGSSGSCTGGHATINRGGFRTSTTSSVTGRRCWWPGAGCGGIEGRARLAWTGRRPPMSSGCWASSGSWRSCVSSFAPGASGRYRSRSGGKTRRLGIPTLRDRVVQAALKLVLEPIFEADFQPCAYGFRPRRRAQDAIAEIHQLTSRSYEWIVEADIEACFDSLDHTALTGRVRAQVGDRRVLRLVKAFLKAGIMNERGDLEETRTGTPQGGILSPLLANIALAALDEHFARAWQAMGSGTQRHRRRLRGEATYRLVRYADDFVICVAGERRHAQALVAEVERVLRPLGLALSREKTAVTHIDEGFDFLGWRIKRGRGRHGRPAVHTYASKRSLQSVKAKVKEITTTGYQQTLDQLLARLNPVLRGWCAYFQHGVSSQTFSYLDAYTWRRVICWLQRKHPQASWRWLRRRYLPGWRPTGTRLALYDPRSVRIIRYRYRGERIATPWQTSETAA